MFLSTKRIYMPLYKGDDIYYSIKIISSTTNNTQKIS